MQGVVRKCRYNLIEVTTDNSCRHKEVFFIVILQNTNDICFNIIVKQRKSNILCSEAMSKMPEPDVAPLLTRHVSAIKLALYNDSYPFPIVLILPSPVVKKQSF